MRPTAHATIGHPVTRRHLLAISGASAALGLLAACGRPLATAPTATATAAAQPVTLEWLTRQPYDNAFDLAIARFRTLSPMVQIVRSQQANNSAFDAKLETLIAGGTPPDIAFAVGSTYHAQAARGFYDDLTPYVNKDTAFDLKDFVPFWLEAGKFRGKLYFFPFDPGTMVLFWNKGLFAKAGVPAPSAQQPMTWPAFQEIAQRLSKKPPDVPAAQLQFGAGLDMSRDWYLLPWQMGVEVFDTDFTKCLLNDATAIDAVQFAVDLAAKYAVMRPPGFPGPATSFNAGNVATQQNGYWESGPSRMVLKPKGEDFDVAPLPTFPGRPRLTIGWGSGNAMTAGGAHKAMAWQFIKHLSDKEVYDILLDQGVMQPVRVSQAEDPAFRRHTPPYNFDVPLDDTKTARTPPFHPAMTEIPGMVGKALADALAGKSTVKTVLDQLVPQIDQKLADYNTRYPAH